MKTMRKHLNDTYEICRVIGLKADFAYTVNKRSLKQWRKECAISYAEYFTLLAHNRVMRMVRK